MLVVPVIDLQDGLAVHANGGQRCGYAPLSSALCRSAHPADVLDAYLDYFPFSCVYIADLNALAGDAERHRPLLLELTRRHPALRFWIDAGLSRPPPEAWRPVIGTESLGAARQWEDRRHLDPILSLDYRNDRLLTESPFDAAALQCDDVIVMDLDRVGAAGGPWVERLQRLRRERRAARLYAAGGIGGADDLRRLAAVGVDGALLATALHSGRISASELSALSG